VVYDNQSYMHHFPTALGYIATMFQRMNCDVEIWNQDLHHYPDEMLTDYLNKNKFDIVGMSFVGGYYQYRRLLFLSDAINKSKQRPLFVLGGHMVSPDPEYFIKKTKADIIVIGEGENVVVDIVNGKRTSVQRGNLIKNLDNIPFPAYELFPMECYRLLRKENCENTDFVMPIISSRGCTFKCNFCYRMDKGFRPRSIESIVEEIKLLKADYGINYIVFNDELLMSSVDRAIKISNALSKLNIKWWCNGRLNYAKSDLLKLMKQSGCVFINYGVESVDNDVLRKMNKALTVKQIINGVEATLEAGISPGLNVIWGNIGDTLDILDRNVRFLIKYGDGSQLRTIRPVTPYPGSPLFDHAVEQGLIKDVEDFYENKHTNSDLLTCNFTKMTEVEMNIALYRANRMLIADYYSKKSNKTIQQARNLYTNNNENFRGFRQI